MFFNLPDTKSNRFTSLGKGQRHDITKEKRNDCNRYYDLPSMFNSKRPQGPCYSFGIARDNYENVYCEENLLPAKNSPGPGKYEVKPQFGKDSPKITFSGILDEKFFDFRKKSPPPGQYNDNLSINSSGKYPISNIKNTIKIVFGQDTRFHYSCK